MSDLLYKDIFDEAFACAKEAADLYRREHGEPMFCGFAWVDLRPATHPAVKAYRRIYAGDQTRLGHKGHPSGWQIWAPGAGYTQSMDIKVAAAEAFAKEVRDRLRGEGLEVSVGSRAD